jgi:DNA mismatch endonuclease (patch repair protein)
MKYIRDGRSPIPEKESTSRVMSANKGKNTAPELILRKHLWKSGIRGYRLHWNKAPGRPDIAFPSKKIAIFVNGCFWHRCPYCNPSFPKSNIDFWEKKFAKNKARDLKKIQDLINLGWRPLVLWECQINNDIDSCVQVIYQLINGQIYQ